MINTTTTPINAGHVTYTSSSEISLSFRLSSRLISICRYLTQDL